MRIRYFTVFDQNYAARGAVMMESLRKFLPKNADITVFALDAQAANASSNLADEIIPIEFVDDQRFQDAKITNTHEEFCWLCAPVLSHHMLTTSSAGDLVIYLDADLYFFSSPDVILDEMRSEKNIMIHPHRFSSRRTSWAASTGDFNVGLVAFRVSPEAIACAARWREQVLVLCVKDPSRGLCGDQGYLNEWPRLYADLQIIQNIGGGTAPWNVEDYDVTATNGLPEVNGTPIVFYHFHQLRIVNLGKQPFLGAICATGYRFPNQVMRLIYDPYLVALKQRSLGLLERGIPIRPAYVFGMGNFYKDINFSQVRFVPLTYLDQGRCIVFFFLRGIRKVMTKLGICLPENA